MEVKRTSIEEDIERYSAVDGYGPVNTYTVCRVEGQEIEAGSGNTGGNASSGGFHVETENAQKMQIGPAFLQQFGFVELPVSEKGEKTTEKDDVEKADDASKGKED